MGVSISSHSSLAPISLASTIIGFASFAFTVATLLRVSWVNFETFSAASTEIPDVLGNLKAGLFEERRHLRKVIRWQRKQRRRSASGRRGGEKEPGHSRRDLEIGDRTVLLLRDTVKHMIWTFRQIEGPFLRVEHEEKMRQARRGEIDREDWDTDGFAWFDVEADESNYTYRDYRPCGFRERWLWVRRKADCISLSENLARVQTRRIANEVGESYIIVGHMQRDWRHLDDRLWALENRLSNVVGVRRVE